mmetsp:Transcript_114942/g.179550  ORF Transcript_114942/g.179550 Transcript_114942/m.179550 type:complete len:84 (+) Transcript_114942:640-891(+)
MTGETVFQALLRNQACFRNQTCKSAEKVMSVIAWKTTDMSENVVAKPHVRRMMEFSIVRVSSVQFPNYTRLVLIDVSLQKNPT